MAKTLFSAHVVATVGVRDLLRLVIDPIDETWYLYVLFFLYVFCYGIEKIKANEELKLFILLLVSFAAEFLPLALSSPLYRMLHYGFFFYLGVYVAKKPDSLFTTKTARYICYGLTASITVLFFMTGSMSGIRLVNIIVSLVLSMAVILYFMGRSDNRESMGKVRGAVYDSLNCTGRYALEVYLLHTYVITVCRVALPKVGVTHFVPNMVICFLLCVLVPIGAVLILKKIKLHTLIFRPVALWRIRNEE